MGWRSAAPRSARVVQSVRLGPCAALHQRPQQLARQPAADAVHRRRQQRAAELPVGGSGVVGADGLGARLRPHLPGAFHVAAVSARVADRLLRLVPGVAAQLDGPWARRLGGLARAPAPRPAPRRRSRGLRLDRHLSRPVQREQPLQIRGVARRSQVLSKMAQLVGIEVVNGVVLVDGLHQRILPIAL